MNLTQLPIKQVSTFVMQNSSTILAGLAIVGVATTVGLAIDATPKALALIDIEQYNREQDCLDEGRGLMPEPMTRMDVIKVVWRCYQD